jgi:hypothetical protein
MLLTLMGHHPQKASFEGLKCHFMIKNGDTTTEGSRQPTVGPSS